MKLIDAPTGALLRDREGRLWLRSTRGAMQLGVSLGNDQLDGAEALFGPFEVVGEVGRPGGLDLHALVKREGLEVVAEAAGSTVRAIKDMRSGRSRMTVDELWRLSKAWADFDVLATIRVLGERRAEKEGEE
jgi:hypothetical protein